MNWHARIPSLLWLVEQRHTSNRRLPAAPPPVSDRRWRCWRPTVRLSLRTQMCIQQPMITAAVLPNDGKHSCVTQALAHKWRHTYGATCLGVNTVGARRKHERRFTTLAVDASLGCSDISMILRHGRAPTGGTGPRIAAQAPTRPLRRMRASAATHAQRARSERRAGASASMPFGDSALFICACGPPIRVGSRTGVGPRRPARRRRRAGSRDERMRRSSEKAFTAPDIHTVLYDSYNSVL